jgi:hypothetical protein
VLAWLPQARTEDDFDELDGATEIVDFVKSPCSDLDGAEHRLLGPAAGGRAESWIVEVRRPSWVKGLGVVLGGLAIPGVAFLVLSKRDLS